jgi:hypothetical protein
VIKPALLAALLFPLAANAQNSLTLNWSLGGGPTIATPSGRHTRLPSTENCFSCKKTDQIITGADVGKFHAALRASGQPGSVGLAIQMELMFNHTISVPHMPAGKTCTQFACEQQRNALVDDAWIIGGGFEFAPLKDVFASPYVAVTGGLSLNQLQWNEDSTMSSVLTGKAVQFGPYVAAGIGVRLRISNSIAGFVDWRYYATLVTPGATMRPLSFGLLFRTRLTDDLEY